jgi:hypothetical protein
MPGSMQWKRPIASAALELGTPRNRSTTSEVGLGSPVTMRKPRRPVCFIQLPWSRVHLGATGGAYVSANSYLDARSTAIELRVR